MDDKANRELRFEDHKRWYTDSGVHTVTIGPGREGTRPLSTIKTNNPYLLISLYSLLLVIHVQICIVWKIVGRKYHFFQ